MIPGLGRFVPATAPASSLIVAAGGTSTSTAYIATSPDGITWTSRSVTGGALNGVAYSPSLGLYCAVGNAGLIVTSPDGVTWTSRTSGTSDAIFGVIWGIGVFVAFGFNAGIRTSSDGITWTSRTNPLPTGGYRGGTVFGSRLILIGSDGAAGGRIAYSDNGTSWTAANTNTGDWFGGAASAGLMVLTGNLGRIQTSANTTSWTSQSSGTSSDLRDAEWNGSLFAAVGVNQLRTSPDGVTWTDRSGGISNRTMRGVTWTGTQFVAVGESGGPLTPRVYTSPDGLTWTERSTGLSSAGFTAVCS